MGSFAQFCKEPALDIVRRRMAWHPLSWLYLDTELDESHFRLMADMLVSSGYSANELEYILRYEVGPVLYTNMWCVAGVWNEFDQNDLEQRILKIRSGWRLWLPRPSGFKVVRRDWECVCHLMSKRLAPMSDIA